MVYVITNLYVPSIPQIFPKPPIQPDYECQTPNPISTLAYHYAPSTIKQTIFSLNTTNDFNIEIK